jgi:putative two-component system response regulator
METNTILVVDDEAINRILIKTALTKENYNLIFAHNGREALDILAKESVDVILLDIMMPELNGFDVLKIIKEDPSLQSIPVIMITALSDRSSLKEALKLGADEFLNKPFDLEELTIRIKNMLKIKNYADKLKDVNKYLEKMVDEKTSEIQTSLWIIKKTETDIISILGRASEFRDTDTGNHLTRMSLYSELLAKKAGLSENEQELILLASPMHDVGKIGIPDEILLKPGKLDPQEFEQMKTHSQIGYDILSSKRTPLLEVAKTIALTHHEKWDGSGYPNALKGEEIHIYGRICAIADVFDALTSVRPYKKSLSHDETLKIMTEGRGIHFDPTLLDLFIDSIEEALKIKSKFS